MQIRDTLRAILLLAVVGAPPAFGEDIRDYYSEPGLNPFKETLNQNFNEHIDPFSGTLQLKYTDVHVPGNGGMDIDLTRTYTSLQTNSYPKLNINGLGWTMHFGRIVASRAHLQKVCNQTIYNANTGDNPSLELPDGGRELLVLNGIQNDGSLITRSNWRATCSAQPGLMVTAPNGTRYTMDRFDNFQEEPAWLTTRIEDVHGNWIAIDYATNPVGVTYMTAIRRSEDGTVVTFEYEDQNTHGIAVSAVITNGQRWSYAYELIPGYMLGFYKQLVRVTRPDGKSWVYNYNPKMPDPNPGDEIPEDGIASYSLNRVTYPRGASIAYTYQYVLFAPDSMDKTTVIHTKTVSGSAVTSGLWTYTFAPFSVPHDDGYGGQLRFDQTTVTAPETIYRYVHMGKDYRNGAVGQTIFVRPSFVGMLISKEIQRRGGSGNVIERQRNVWGERKISDEDFWHGAGYRSWWRDNGTYMPVLVGEYSSRDSQVGGTTYTHARVYSNHDIYGNAGRVLEHSNVANQPSRQVDYTYYTDTARWIIGLPKNETYYTVNGTQETEVGTVQREYDLRGKLEEIVEFGQETRFTYTGNGDLETVRDARGKVTSFFDYRRGIPEREQHPESVTIHRVVNDTGTLRSETNGRGFIARYTYDDLNRLESIDYPIKADVSIDYDDAMGVYKRILTRGTYRQTETINDFGETIRLERNDTATGQAIVRTKTFDAQGRETFASYPNSAIGLTKTWDALGRLERMRHPDNTTVVYSYDDGRVTVTNERGFEATYLYLIYGTDFAGQEPILIREPENVSTKITRDIWGNPLQVFQGERTSETTIRGYGKTYRYNDRRLLVEANDPEVGTTIFNHDAVGNVVSERVNNLPLVTFAYDGLNRRTRVDFSDATPDVITEYDDNDNAERITKGTTEWFYVYDQNDNLTSERLTINHPLFAPRVYLTTHEYSDLDVPSVIHYPSGLAIDYLPDAFGRATKVGTFASNVAYHPSGALASYQLANGITTTVALNQRLMTQSITAPGVVNLSYTYDEGANVTRITDGIDSTKSVLMNVNGYDGLDRLRRVSGKWGLSLFTYDFHGNILTKSQGSREMIYRMDGQRRARHIDKQPLSQPYYLDGHLRYEYDGRGNAIAKREYAGQYGLYSSINEKAFDYDAASNLIRARVSDTTESGTTEVAHKNYVYDGNGQRVVEQKYGSYDIRFSVYSRAGQLLFEDSVAECMRSDYVRLGAMSVARSDDRPATPAADTDGDQIPDCLETQLGMNPNSAGDAAADNDSDGLSNLEEYRAGTSLARADTDGDGLSDRDELNRDLTDPNSGDTDGDGIADGIEAANPNLDPRLADRDHDGVLDSWELELGTNPNNPSDGLLDSDADGFSNRQESNAKSDPKLATENPKRGTQLWARDILGAVIGSAAIGRDRTIHVASVNGRVTAFHPDGTKRWTFGIPGTSVSNPVIGPDGTIYTVMQLQSVPQGSPRSFVYALNADGTERWVRPSFDNLTTSVVVGDNGRIYAGGYRFTGDTIHALIVILDSAGQITGSRILASNAAVQRVDAVAASGDVYALVNNTVYALSATLEPRWTYNLRSTPYALISIARDGSLYVGDGAGYVYALTSAGALRWEQQFSAAGSQQSSVAIGADGTLYIGGFSSTLFAVNATDGSQRWSASTSGTVFTPALAANGNIYASTYAGDLVAFDSAGTELWSLSSGSRITQPPVVDRDGTIYFGTQTGQLLAVADNGGGPARAPWPMHRHDSAASGFVCFNESAFSTVFDSDGDHIDDCTEMRLGMDPANPADGAADPDGDGLPSWEEVQRGTRRDLADTDGDGLSDGLEVLTYHTNPLAVDSDHDTIADGREIELGTNPLDAVDAGVDSDNDGFSNRQESLAGTDPLNASSRPAEGQLVRAESGTRRTVVVGGDGTIYQTVPNGPGTYLEALYPDFTRKWNLLFPSWETPTIGADGTIYIVEVPTLTLQGKQRILALWPNGLIRWVHLVDVPAALHGVFGPVVIGANGKIHFVYSTNDGQGDYLRTLDSNGNPSATWPYSMQFYGRDPTVSVGPDGSVAVYDAAYSLSYYNNAGAMQWQTRQSPVIGGGAGTIVFGSTGTVYASNSSGLSALNPANGASLWRQTLARSSPLIDASNNLITSCGINTPRPICAVDTNGQIVWQETTGYAFTGMPVIDASGAILSYTTNDRFVALNGNGTLRWATQLAPSTALKATNHPVVLADGTIYLTAVPQNLLIIGGGRGLANSMWPAPSRDHKNSRNAAGIVDVQPSPAPTVSITSASGTVRVEVGQNLSLSAVASDYADGDLGAAIQWSSSLDGPLGTGTLQSLMPLSVGVHTLTARVTDSAGLTASATITIEKAVFPPTLTLIEPSLSQTVDYGQRIIFRATAVDTLDGDITHRIRWTSDRDGLFGGGGFFYYWGLSVGTHVVTVSAADLAGATDSETLNIIVQVMGPTMNVNSPGPGEYQHGVPLYFSGSAYDPADGDVSSSMHWSSNLDGLLGTGPSFNSSSLSLGAHVITVTSTDSMGTTATETRQILLRDFPPTVEIYYPNTSQYDVGTQVPFGANANDQRDGDVSASLQWSSSLDGSIGTGHEFQRSDLSVGTHLITAKATDSTNSTGTAEREVTIVSATNTPPTVSITAPSAGTQSYATDPLQLRATASDAQGAVTVQWSSSRDGALGTGLTLATSALTVGQHTIKALAIDGGGAKAAAMVNITILPVPANFPPVVTLTPPAIGARYTITDAFPLGGVATDREDGDISNRLQWSSSLNGPLGTGATVFASGLSVGTHTITASAVDNFGNTTTRTLQLEIFSDGASRHLEDTFSTGSGVPQGWVVFDDGTPTPSNWSIASGRMVEMGDAQAGDAAGSVIDKPGTYLRHTAGAYWLDYRLEATLRSTDDDALGLMFRYVDNNNYYRFSMDRERSYRRLVKKVNGVYTTLWLGDTTRYSLSTNVPVIISAVGSTLTLSINGTQVYSGTDASHRRGTIALYSWGENQAQFDNVRVFNLRTTNSNDAPLVTISSPANNSTVVLGSVVSLNGTALDFEDGTLSHALAWSSSRDGALGTGAALNVSSLTVGTHVITASATDSRSTTGSATVNLTVNEPFNDPPVLNVSAPTEGASFNVGTNVNFTGTAIDLQDGTISNGISWTSSRNGLLGTAASLSVSTLSAGTHVITARITDSGGKFTTVTRNITIVVPNNTPPVVTVTAPLNGAAFGVGQPVALAATATDTQDGTLTGQITWTSSRDGSLGTGGTLNITTLTGGTHTITATVNDSMGGSHAVTRAISVVPTAATLVRDDFNDNNFTGWTVTNEGTVSAPSVWSASTGALRQTSDISSTPTTAATLPKPGTFNRYTAGSAWTNYSVTTELRSSDNDTLGVMFRYTNATNYYRFSMDSERAIRRLTKVRNGTWTSLWSDTTAYQLNQPYVLEIIANGSTITVKLDGVQLWSGTDTNTLTTGTVAMYSWMNTGAQFDNVLVRNLSVPFSSVVPTAPSFGEGLLDGVIGAVRSQLMALFAPKPPPSPSPEPIRIAMLTPMTNDHRSREQESAP